MPDAPSLGRFYIDLPIARPGSPAAYMLTAFQVALATLARLLIDPWIAGSQFIFFFPAVMLTTFLFGARAGALAVALSTMSAFFFILPPRFSFELTGLPEIIALAIFAGVAAGDVVIVGLLRAALAHLSRLQALDAAIFESNPDAVIVTDKNGIITRVNRRTEMLFGYQPGTLINKPIELLVPDRLRTKHIEHRTGFAIDPQIREMGIGLDLIARRASGETFPVDVQIGPISGEDDARMIATVRDITDAKAAAGVLAESLQRQAALEERQHSAEELHQAHATLSTVIESAPTAIWAIDANDRIIMWNPASAEIYGTPSAAALGRPWREVVKGLAPLDTRSPEELVQVAREQGGFHNIEVKRVARDGITRELSISAAPLHDGDNTVLATLFTAHDITQTKELERRLRQSQKMEAIGQLTGGVAHDFNNLLAVIYGNLELLKDQWEGSSPGGHLVDGALQAARHGSGLIRRLLAFSRQQLLAPSAVDVETLVVGTTEMLRHMVEESIDIVTAISPGLWKCRIDAEQLANALVNLVVNARDAMPDGGTLTITVENATLSEAFSRDWKDLTAGSYVKLSISDTGVGMTKAILDRVLEPFFTTKPFGRGTGLGLSMAYGFAKQSGGHLTIASEPGQGTTVCLYLPKLEAEPLAVPVAKAMPTPIAAEGEVILLVEDDETVRNLQSQSLQKLGYRTIEATDGPSCLDIAKSTTRIDLMLTDIVLPGGMGGPALAEAARAIRPGLKVVFMSGYAPDDLRQRYDLSGARSLVKPFTRSELAQVLRETLEEAPNR
jgi:PAS domain S-box-containing protein